MSTNKPKPVAWEIKHHPVGAPIGSEPERVQIMALTGADLPTVRVAITGKPFRDLSVMAAECEGATLLMAAAVARGEPDNAQALRRAVDALGVESTTVAELADADRDTLAAAEQARAAAVQEAARLRVQCDIAADVCGVPTVAAVPEAWRVLAADRDRLAQHLASAEAALGEAQDAAAKAAGDWTCGDCGTLHRKAPPVFRCACGTSRGKPPVGEGDSVLAQVTATREPKTHHNLASIEEHGVVVGDRLSMGSSVALRHVAMAAGVTLTAKGSHGNTLADGDAVGFAVVECVGGADV